MSEVPFVPVAATDDILDGATLAVTVNADQIVLCHHEGNFYAIENRCSHRAEPLTCGVMRRGWIACPAHGARFDLATGEVLGPPATAPIRTFPVRVVDGTIEVAA